MDQLVSEYQISAHYATCEVCYCSAGRAQILAHIQTQTANRKAVEQEFTTPQPEPARLGPSDFYTPIPAPRLSQNEAPSCACTICNAARNSLQSSGGNVSGGSWLDQFLGNVFNGLLGGPRQLSQDEPRVLEPERDRLGV